MRKVSILILLVTICGGCDRVDVESNTNRSINETPSTSLDPVDDQNGENQTLDDKVENLNIARGFDAPDNEFRAESFATTIEAVTTPGSSPNLTGTWIWSWTRSGSFDPVGDPASSIDLFQYFGFEILTIEDFGDGRLALQFCLDQTTTTLFYNDNDELSMESAGSVVGTIESSSKFRLFEAVRGGIEYPDAINFAAGTVNKDVFTRMNSDLNSTIAQLTTTLPEGSSYSYPLTCVVYWEKAFNDQEGAKFDNFYMYNGEEAGTEQGVASEHHGSLYIQQSQRITIYSDDTDGDGTVVSGIELGEF